MGHMPLMGFTTDGQTAGQHSAVAGDFMQQILTREDVRQAPVNIAPMIEVEQGLMDFNLEKNYAVVTASEVLTKYKLPEVSHAQDPVLSPKEVRQTRESTSESTVVYLLHWLATGHLSHIASDLTASVPGQTQHTAIHALAHNDNSSNDFQPLKKLGEVTFEGNKIGFKNFDNHTLDIDSSEHECQRKAADAATFSEQISPYLKRRLIVSAQEDHTHIILRDYFLDDQGNFSALKDLLTNIKQNISGDIKLTINGHHYGDINNYR
jgi:hypothetical protein